MQRKPPFAHQLLIIEAGAICSASAAGTPLTPHPLTSMKPTIPSPPDSLNADSFEKLMGQFIAQKITSRYSPSTATKSRYALNKLGRWIIRKNLRLSRLHFKDIKAFCMEQRKTCSERTLQTQFNSSYRPFFRWLKEEGIIRKDPTERLILPRHPVIPSCPTKLRDELLALSVSVPTSVIREEKAIWIGFIVHAGFLLGMRKNEIMLAREEWFDFEKRCVRIPSNPAAAPELQKVRVVPMSERLLTFLIIYHRVDPWRPRSDTMNSPPTPPKCDRRFPFRIFLDWAGKRLGRDLRWITPSVMRCTYAGHLLKSKVTRRDVARWMGISESFMAKYYARGDKGPSGVK